MIIMFHIYIRIYNIYFRYHVELVKLLACCTMGKNVNTEIKCHSLLPLDDIVAMVSHPDCIPEVSYLIIISEKKNIFKMNYE